jgi:transposase
MPLPIRVVELRRGDRATLERWVRGRTTPRRVVERARIVLASADGQSGQTIGAAVGVSRPTVTRWLDRYAADGVPGLLADRPRSGQPKQISPAEEARIVAKTLHEAPPDGGTRWSTRLMARVTGLHPTTISRLWRTHGLKPHQIAYFKVSTDPDFVAKLRDVVGLYLDPPKRAVVFLVDEKSQIQALDRTQPGLPLKKGRAGTFTHDYKRHGATTLFAALDVATGQIHHDCLPRHRRDEFLRFMTRLEHPVPRGLGLHMILDNYATHKTPEVEQWVRRLAVTSVAELETAIDRYIARRNADPQPFTWTASVKTILAKVRKANETLASLH